MYELKENGKVFTSTFVGMGPSSYKKITYRAAVSQRLRNIALHDTSLATSKHAEIGVICNINCNFCSVMYLICT